MSASSTPGSDVEAVTQAEDEAARGSAEGGFLPAPKGRDGFFDRLYTGTGVLDVVGRRKFYYALTAVILAVCLLSILFRGFTFGIDFTGGTKLTMPAAGVDDKDRVAVVVEEALGFEPQAVQIIGAGNARVVEVETEFLTSEQVVAAKNALFEEYQPTVADGTPSLEAIGDSARSESWGGQVTKQALIALGVFLVVVFGYIMMRFEWRMSTAAIAALIFDLVVTMGVYSLVGFEVTPATIIGLLTILGFSLYDTVVVFDKLQENMRGLNSYSKYTYGEEANIAVNQTLMRSIHTTIIGLLPLLALVVIAVWMLGVGTLKDLALVQIIGIITGTFSSIFLAAPVLVTLKERTSEVRDHTAKVLARREREREKVPA